MNMQRAVKRSRLQEGDRLLIRYMGSASPFLIGNPAVSVRPCRRSDLIPDISKDPQKILGNDPEGPDLRTNASSRCLTRR
jgi:hypothetical protein